MWKLLDNAEGADKAENLRIIKQRLEALAGEIPWIRRLEVRCNINPAPNQYDAVLISTFDTLADVEAYRVHPAHQAVAGFVKKVRESRAAVDYED